MKTLRTLVPAVFLGLMVHLFVAPSASAQPAGPQSRDCAELQSVISATETPLADPAAEGRRTAINAAVQAGFEALQCARGDGGQPMEINPAFFTRGYESRCPVVASPPTPPTGQVSQAQYNEAVAGFNAWAETNLAAAACRRAEVDEVERQAVVTTAALAAWNFRTEQQSAEAAAELRRRVGSR